MSDKEKSTKPVPKRLFGKARASGLIRRDRRYTARYAAPSEVVFEERDPRPENRDPQLSTR